jgi:hypothetical protein
VLSPFFATLGFAFCELAAAAALRRLEFVRFAWLALCVLPFRALLFCTALIGAALF